MAMRCDAVTQKEIFSILWICINSIYYLLWLEANFALTTKDTLVCFVRYFFNNNITSPIKGKPINFEDIKHPRKITNKIIGYYDVKYFLSKRFWNRSFFWYCINFHMIHRKLSVKRGILVYILSSLAKSLFSSTDNFSCLCIPRVLLMMLNMKRCKRCITNISCSYSSSF